MVVVSNKDKQEIVNKSLEDCIRLLKRYRKAFLSRPTGFGKTWIGSELAKTDKVTGKKWNKVIFIVPLHSITEGIEYKYQEKLEGVNYVFVTYQSLARAYTLMGDKQGDIVSYYPYLDGMDEGLFIFEEAHKFGYLGENREGVNKASRFISKILERFPKAYYFGSTATPYRTDGADMMYTFFEGNIAFLYNLKMAIEDGFYRKVTYIDGNCQISDDFGKMLEDNIDNSKSATEEDKKVEKAKLRAKIAQYGELRNLENTIKLGLDNTDCPKDYMRFLVFFSSEKALKDGKQSVIDAFQKAYPDMKIRHLKITSAEDSDDNIKMVDIEEDGDCGSIVYSLPRELGTIDLIFTINKLAMGYHDNMITGVMLMRFTMSNVMLDQIVGRCFDMEINHQTVIFDIMSNYDVDLGIPISLKSILKEREENTRVISDGGIHSNNFDKTCVNTVPREVEEEDLHRLSNLDRLQHERELVWCYKNGIFEEEFCARELNIDVDAWMNVIMYHKDITGEEPHESV